MAMNVKKVAEYEQNLKNREACEWTGRSRVRISAYIQSRRRRSRSPSPVLRRSDSDSDSVSSGSRNGSIGCEQKSELMLSK
mmetsp:Transcript_1650/g.2939  ORF Transcript_1650/g.2939 Transcript_1650/m.2939 type:complete len:81 (+) Transcript_1650:118-360(+)